jgi:uncharacterized protein
MNDFDFDPKKNLSNVDKHGVDFAAAARIWDGYVFERQDGRKDYGETRVIALGAVEGRVFVVVYTWRNDRRRLISARKANTDEKQIYEEALARLAAREKD